LSFEFYLLAPCLYYHALGSSAGAGGGATVAVSLARNSSSGHNPTPSASYDDWRGGYAAYRINPSLFNTNLGGGGTRDENDEEREEVGATVRSRSLATGVSGGTWGVVRVPRSDGLSSDFDLLARGSGNFTGGKLIASGVVAAHESPFADAAVMLMIFILFVCVMFLFSIDWNNSHSC